MGEHGKIFENLEEWSSGWESGEGGKVEGGWAGWHSLVGEDSEINAKDKEKILENCYAPRGIDRSVEEPLAGPNIVVPEQLPLEVASGTVKAYWVGSHCGGYVGIQKDILGWVQSKS